MTKTENEIKLMASAKTNPGQLAGSVYKNWEEGKKVTITAIGAGAVNQAIKACAIARGFFAPAGVDEFLRVGFKDVEIDGKPRTAIFIEVIAE